jgi:hypothetical protein
LGIAVLIIGSVVDAAPPPQNPPANNRLPPVKNAQPGGPSERRKAELQGKRPRPGLPWQLSLNIKTV